MILPPVVVNAAWVALSAGSRAGSGLFCLEKRPGILLRRSVITDLKRLALSLGTRTEKQTLSRRGLQTNHHSQEAQTALQDQASPASALVPAWPAENAQHLNYHMMTGTLTLQLKKYMDLSNVTNPTLEPDGILLRFSELSPFC